MIINLKTMTAFCVFFFMLLVFSCKTASLSNSNDELFGLQNLRELEGTWNVYRTEKGTGNINCKIRECGIGVGVMKLRVDKNTLKGKHLTGISSRVGKAHWEEITSSFENDEIKIKFVKPNYYSLQYKINKILPNRLSGMLEIKGIENNNLDLVGDFVAVRESSNNAGN